MLLISRRAPATRRSASALVLPSSRARTASCSAFVLGLAALEIGGIDTRRPLAERILVAEHTLSSSHRPGAGDTGRALAFSRFSARAFDRAASKACCA